MLAVRLNGGVRSWLVLAVLLGCSLLGCTSSDTPSQTRPGSLREAIDTDVEAQFEAADAFDSVRAILVAVDDQLVYQRYWDSRPDDYWPVQSVTKSVMSTLVGIAVEEGRLALDDTLAELLPAYTSVMSPSAKETTLEQLLTMTGGFPAEGSSEEAAVIRAGDWVAAALRAARPPGEFSYSNAGAHLLSAILVEATGTSVLDYARSRLFDPLGIPSRPSAEPPAESLVQGHGWTRYEKADFGWPVDRQGRHLGASLLRLRPQDMLRLGQLYLDDGRWEGRQVLPADWVAAATRRQIGTGGSGPNEGYGYLWWTEELGDHEAAIAYGYGGQVIALVPDLRAVVVVSTELHLDRPPTRGNRGVSRSPLLYLVQWAILRNLAEASDASA